MHLVTPSWGIGSSLRCQPLGFWRWLKIGPTNKSTKFRNSTKKKFNIPEPLSVSTFEIYKFGIVKKFHPRFQAYF